MKPLFNGDIKRKIQKFKKFYFIQNFNSKNFTVKSFEIFIYLVHEVWILETVLFKIIHYLKKRSNIPF